jgi:hypothetical protein
MVGANGGACRTGPKNVDGRSLADQPLYGSERVNGYDPDRLIVLTEGEEAAQALLDAGLAALGTVTDPEVTPGPRALEVLRDREVTLWPVADEASLEHMRRIAESLQDIAAAVRFYEWSDAPDKGDAADHPAITSGDTKATDLLLNELMCAPRWTPTSELRAMPSTTIPEIFTAAELMELELPPVRWVVPEILPEGVTFLAGKPKLGKSWKALGIGVAVTTGGMALGTKSVEEGEVLYLALEDNKRRLKQRLTKLLSDRAKPPGLHMAIEWPRADEGGVERLADFLIEHPNTRLVVIDTFARFKSRTTGRRSQYDEDRDAVDPLIPIAAEHNVAILLVHHLRESESDDPLDMIHGSAGLTGGVDGALVLKRQRGRADAFLHVDGRDIEYPMELALKFDQTAATWAIIGEAEEYRMSEGRREIQSVLAEADEPLGPKEITAILDERLGANAPSYGAVGEMLSQMVKDGQAQNLGRGQYVHPDFSQRHPDNPDSLTNEKGNVS